MRGELTWAQLPGSGSCVSTQKAAVTFLPTAGLNWVCKGKKSFHGACPPEDSQKVALTQPCR